MNNNLDILDSQDISLKKQLEKDAAAFREEKFCILRLNSAFFSEIQST